MTTDYNRRLIILPFFPKVCKRQEMQQWGKSIDAAWFSAVSHETGETYWYTVREGLRPSSLRSWRFVYWAWLASPLFSRASRAFLQLFFFFSRQASVIYAGYGRVFYCICNASALKNCHSSFMLDYDFDCRCLMVLFTDQYLTESLSKPTWKHFIWQKMKWKDGYESIRWFSEWFSSILV